MGGEEPHKMIGRVDGAEVAKHGNRHSCWIVVHGKAYDVTSFLDQHPGGDAVILRLAGQDASEDYDAVHYAELIEEVLPASAFRGHIDPATIAPKKKYQSKPSPMPLDSPQTGGDPSPVRAPQLSSIVSVDDFERVAEKHLSPIAWAYYSSAADDEQTKLENRGAFQKLTFRPRCLRNVDTVDLTTTILGKASTLPIYISSTGLGKYAHPDAELALARAAGREGICQLIPTSPSMPIDKIIGAASVPDQVFWQQVYVNRDRQKAKGFIRMAEQLGVSAIWVTVDSPVLGKRERDDRLKAQLLADSNNDEVDGDDNLVDPTSSSKSGGVAAAATKGVLNPTLTWDDLKWIRAATSLPLVLKGIQCVEDAILAYQHGVQGIVLSNHGGRSQDTAQAPMATLLEIHKYAPYILGREMEVYVDGGVRRGTDVVKALALGATAVGVGRPCVYSMSGGYGEAGVRRLFQILRNELAINMAMVGAPSIKDIVAEMINTRRLEKEVSGMMSKL